MAIDDFTIKRLVKFVRDFRERQGQLPTLKDLEDAHFSHEAIEAALKKKKIEQFYLTLTNGSVVKGFKITVE